MRFGFRSAVAIALVATAACPALLSAPAAVAASVPKPGSTAAREVGGRLMARSGIVVANLPRGAQKLPKVPASAWVVANAGTGEVLAARDPHGEFGPASTLKVLTAITLIPRLNSAAMIPATKLATSVEPNVAGLITGRQYQVASLFRALLLISANDAAVALTQAVGSFARGMALINAEARQLQAYDVVAKLPNGLPAPGQIESAYDEALIARQALAMPAFMHYDETLAAKFEVKPHHWETLVNQNYLLTRYRGGIGGKIGWTMASEATYIGMARRDGVTLIVTVMHCTPLQEIAAAERLLNWGFAMNGKVRPVGQLVPPLGSTAAAAQPSGQQVPAAGQPAATASHPQAAISNPKAAATAQPATASHQPAAGASNATAGQQSPGGGNGAAGAGRQTNAAALASRTSAAHGGLAAYAIVAGAVAVAGIGLGGLVRARRRPAAGRDRE